MNLDLVQPKAKDSSFRRKRVIGLQRGESDIQYGQTRHNASAKLEVLVACQRTLLLSVTWNAKR